MRSLFVILIVSFVVAAVMVFGGERMETLRAERAMANGDPGRAYGLYTSLAGRRLLFLDRQDLATRREAAAVEGLAVTLRGHSFEMAANLVAAVLAGPDTGYEAGARAIRSSMPGRHVEYISHLVREADLDAALVETTTAFRLYGEEPRVLEQVRVLETRAQLGLASEATARGDVARTIDLLADLDAAAPLPEQFQAMTIVATGVEHAADSYRSGRDFAGLLVWFGSVRQKLDHHPKLRHAAMTTAGEFARDVFELPVGEIPDSLDVDEPPLPEPIGPAGRAGYAALTVRNSTRYPITVLLRGERDYRTASPIQPGQSARLVLRAGAYAEAVHAGVPDPVPYLGVLRLAPVEYAQEFTVQEGSSTVSLRR
jgi:hypothetical protein